MRIEHERKRRGPLLKPRKSLRGRRRTKRDNFIILLGMVVNDGNRKSPPVTLPKLKFME